MFYSNTALLPLQDDKIDARAGSDSRLNARPAVHIGGVFNGLARTGKKFVLGIAFLAMLAGLFLIVSSYLSLECLESQRIDFVTFYAIHPILLSALYISASAVLIGLALAVTGVLVLLRARCLAFL